MNDKATDKKNPTSIYEISENIKRWFPADTRELNNLFLTITPVMFAYYVRITSVLWEQGGEVNCDINSIKRICRVRKPTAVKIINELSPHFIETEGKWLHVRLTDRIDQKLGLSKTRSYNAKKQWEERKKRDAHADASALNETVQVHTYKTREDYNLTLIEGEEDKESDTLVELKNSRKEAKK